MYPHGAYYTIIIKRCGQNEMDRETVDFAIVIIL